ncbi:MAG: hypothetical protein R3C24_18240 [Cyanobacteriota/Melainabacteria group bacterium]
MGTSRLHLAFHRCQRQAQSPSSITPGWRAPRSKATRSYFDHRSGAARQRGAVLSRRAVRRATCAALDVAADKITPILRDVYRHTRECLQAADLQRFYDKRQLPNRAEDAELLDLFVALNNCVAAKKWLVESRDLVGIDNSYDRQVEAIRDLR